MIAPGHRRSNKGETFPPEVLTRREGDSWSIQENVGHLADVERLVRGVDSLGRVRHSEVRPQFEPRFLKQRHEEVVRRDSQLPDAATHRSRILAPPAAIRADGFRGLCEVVVC